MNENLNHIGEYRLQVSTANLMQGKPEFVRFQDEAFHRRKELRKYGYVVTIFRILKDGTLEQVG